MATKICSKCGIEKDTSEFQKNNHNKDGLRGWCRSCGRKYVDEHIEQKRQYEKENRYKYRETQRKSQKKYREKNIDKIKERNKSDLQVAKQREWREKNKDIITKRMRIYYLEHKEQWNQNLELRRKRENARYVNDIDYHLTRKLRSRFFKAIRGLRKEDSVMRIIGCSLDVFRKHITSLFTEGMSWDLINSGKIHIDHILPVRAFNMSDPLHQRACFYWKNMQPLWESDNHKKRMKYNQVDFNVYMDWFIKNVENK